MKAILTLTYEKEIDEEESGWLERIVRERNDRMVQEEFRVEWGNERKIEIEFVRGSGG